MGGYGARAQHVRFSEEIPLSYRAYRVERVGEWNGYYYCVRSNRRGTAHEIDLVDRRTLRHVRSFAVEGMGRMLAVRPTDSLLRVWGEASDGGEEMLVVISYGEDGQAVRYDTLQRRRPPFWPLRKHFHTAPAAFPDADAVAAAYPSQLSKEDSLEVWNYSNESLSLQWRRSFRWAKAGTFRPVAASPSTVLGYFEHDRLVRADRPYAAYLHRSVAPALVPLFADSFTAAHVKAAHPIYGDSALSVGVLAVTDLFPSRFIGYGWVTWAADDRAPRFRFQRWPRRLVEAVRGADAPGDYIENLALLHVFTRTDGGGVFLVEVNYKRSEVFQQTSAFGHVQTSRRTYYFSDEVVLFPVDSMGRMEWFQLLLKHQASQEDDALFSSVGWLVQSQRLILLFNNMQQRYWNSEVWEVSPHGRTRRSILFTQKEHPLDVSWRTGRQVDYFTFIAPAYTRRGDKFRLVEVTFGDDRTAP